MTESILIEIPQGRDRVRVEVSDYKGKSFLNVRRWYPDGDLWKPTRQGVTIALASVPDIHAALGAYLASNPPRAS